MPDKVLDVVSPGVVTGDGVQQVFAVAKANGFALPAVNVVGSNSVNAVLEAAAAADSPVIIQFSSSGAAFCAGKSLSLDGHEAAVLGAVAGAQHVHRLADGDHPEGYEPTGEDHQGTADDVRGLREHLER